MTKPKTYKTTEAHFKIFKAECEKWVDIFSLRSWYVDYRHEDDEDPSRAWCSVNWTGRLATFGLAIDWKDNKTDEKQVRKSAFHEVCELLLARLDIEAKADRCQTDRDIIAEQRHAIIRRLEHVVFDR